MPKRLVLQHTQGHSGLFQILALHPDEVQPSEAIGGFEILGGRVEFASLIKVTPRFVLYREATPRPTDKFGEVITGFDPNQQ